MVFEANVQEELITQRVTRAYKITFLWVIFEKIQSSISELTSFKNKNIRAVGSKKTCYICPVLVWKPVVAWV